LNADPHGYGNTKRVTIDKTKSTIEICTVYRKQKSINEIPKFWARESKLETHCAFSSAVLARCLKNSPVMMVATVSTASVTHMGREVERATLIHSRENDAFIGVPASHRLKNMNPAPSGMPVARAMIVGMTHNSFVFGFITGF
jgi:hypothetical protein